MKQGGGGPFSSGVSSGVSLAAVVKGETGLAENPKEEKDTQQKKAGSLEGDTAGLQVSWALIAKILPPWVVHLLRAHPVERAQELCNTHRARSFKF